MDRDEACEDECLWNAGRQISVAVPRTPHCGRRAGWSMVRRCIAKRRVRCCPVVHRAFPKVSKYCRAKRALTLHYQPRFRRNQSMSTHISAALRSTSPRCQGTAAHRAFCGQTEVPPPAACLGPDQKPHSPPAGVPNIPPCGSASNPDRGDQTAQPLPARSADLHFYLIDFDLPGPGPTTADHPCLPCPVRPALSCPCLALPCPALRCVACVLCAAAVLC